MDFYNLFIYAYVNLTIIFVWPKIKKIISIIFIVPVLTPRSNNQCLQLQGYNKASIKGSPPLQHVSHSFSKSINIYRVKILFFFLSLEDKEWVLSPKPFALLGLLVTSDHGLSWDSSSVAIPFEPPYSTQVWFLISST